MFINFCGPHYLVRIKKIVDMGPVRLEVGEGRLVVLSLFFGLGMPGS